MRNREWFHVVVPAFIAFLLSRIWEQLKKKRLQLKDRARWRAHVDEGNIQACLLTSANLNSCGRIEKRTIFVKELSTVYTNEHARRLVLDATKKTSDENPFVCSYVPMEDRWNVLVMAQGQVSSTFGPYHLFSNQVSSFESCWYVLTLIGTRTTGSGRFFVTPRHPLSPEDDFGMKRIRLILINEQELRSICSGEIEQNHEFFNERHQARWEIMKKCASIFEKQVAHDRSKKDLVQLRNESCVNLRGGRDELRLQEPEDSVDENETAANCFLRIHIPVPLLTNTHKIGPRDVVLYE